MALIFKDRIKEGTTTAGTGAYALGGASATFDTFTSCMSNGDTTYYAIAHTTSGIDEWEVGIGTFNTGNTLSRTTVLSGSNGTSAVNFSAGTKNIFMTMPADKIVIEDASNDVTIGRNLTVTGDLTVSGTTTTVNSTTTTVDDPVFTLGGDTAPSSDDNKDRGIEFRYHTGSAAKVGFFGFDDSAGKFTFIPDATNSSEVFSGSAGTIVAALEGNATTATTLATARNIAGQSFDGSANISIAPTDLTGVTATAAELNLLDGVTATTAELNYTDGVTSNIQTQIDTKQPYHTIAVTVVNSGGNKYALDGTVQQTALLPKSVTIRFDQSDSSNASHPLRLSTTSDGTHNSGSAFTTGVSVVGTPGSAGAYTQVTLEQDAPDLLYTYCTNHSGMGGKVYSGKDFSALTSTVAELNILDGVTSTAAELNILDGVTSTAAELNILDGVTATTAELNILDGVTSTTAELNILDGVTSTATELNLLDGVTATTAELNYVDGVTSAIQTQLDAKLPLGGGQMTGNITMAGSQTVDGRDLSADGTKLDGIEASADVTDTANVVAALTAGTNITIAGNGTISSTDTNTTYTAGAGLSLSGTEFTHADTSSQASSDNSGRTYIQDITLDTYGHVTGIATATETVVNTDTNTTYSAGNGLSLSGTTFLMSGSYSGSFTATGNITAYSDETLKDNIVTIENPIEKLNAIRGVTYNRNDLENNPRHAGVIAQEVEKVLPEVVSTDSDGLKSVAYGNMVGLLIEAVKELANKLEALENDSTK